MEQPSVTYYAAQSVDYLDETHKCTDTDVISSYKEICKQFDIAAQQAQQSQRGRMEQPSVAYTVKWTDTDVISYYKENMRKEKTRYLPYLSIIQTRYLSLIPFHNYKLKELSVNKDLQNYPHLEAKENNRDFGKVCEMDVVYFGPYDPESTMYYFPGCYPQGQCIQAKPGTEQMLWANV
ncbi:hypothetical protein RhiirA4_468252 [Rhizophagus irregularis]|uniref:Uncharacterized protein n=1 Tax=Rhizophagus irregularis TaxID=588596 RepID=A0A2I1GXF9_9GLOM|nr:hypothetical protein RhiirA4_468252 [Rhizophagus irregularis]